MTDETLASPVVEHPNDRPGSATGGALAPPTSPALSRLESLEVPPVRRPRRPNRWERPKPPKDWRYWVGGTGRTLIVIGLLLFAFVAYQLWGTGLQQAQAQNRLEDRLSDLEATLSTAPAPSVAPTTTSPPVTEPTAPDPTAPFTVPESTTTTVAPPVPLVEVREGDPLGLIEIPSIGVKQFLVSGVRTEDLRKGPGHYPGTPLPGQLGNAAIAGHRTTYGEPFLHLDDLVVGDEIVVTLIGPRTFTYRVTGTQVVSPSDYEVVLTTDPTVATLTLTTCHPAYSARERLIISAVLDESQSDTTGDVVVAYDDDIDTTTGTLPGDDTVGDPTDDPTTDGSTTAVDGTADAFDAGWFSDPDAYPQVALWAVALIAICLGAYQVAKALRRTWVGVLVGVLPFVVALYFFFENVNRLLPPNL